MDKGKILQPESRLHALVEVPALKYLGFSLLLAWRYCLWFVPQIFGVTHLLNDVVTLSWLIDLASSVIAFFLIPLILGRKRHLSDYRPVLPLASLAAGAATGGLTLYAGSTGSPLAASVCAAVLGVSAAVLWLLWGERYAHTRANFSIKHIAPVLGLVTLAALALASFLPTPSGVIFVTALPLISGGILFFTRRSAADEPFPPLLPKNTSRDALRNIIVVCLISFVTSAACYFLVAIIPWESLPGTIESFTYGVAAGAILILSIAAISTLFVRTHAIFKLFPWLLILTVVSCALFLFEEDLALVPFILSVAISSVIEVLLVMYFGVLTLKGYVPPALAFGLSCGFIRLGIILGNALAIFYERTPGLLDASPKPTVFLFICVLVALLIPLIRQEYGIAALTSVASSDSEVDQVCTDVSGEFGLSERESEILRLIARGYTGTTIAERLFISPYTVNTHLQHIYEKMQIHKRTELFKYLNTR